MSKGESHRLRPTMIAIGSAFLFGLLTIAGFTVAAVLNDDGMDAPEIESLAFPAGVSVIETHSLCSAEACEGEGAVLGSSIEGYRELTAAVERRFLLAGWGSSRCGEGEVCLATGDLRARLTRWLDVTDPATATLKVQLTDRGVEQNDLVYVRLWRCGLVAPCS